MNLFKLKETVLVGQFEGLLSSDSEKKWGEIFDELIKAKSKIIEMLDGFAGHQGVKFIDNMYGDKAVNQEVLEPLANKFTDEMHDLVVNKDLAAYDEVIDTGIMILKEAVPLEKKIGQENEDAVMETIGFGIKFVLDEFVLKSND